VLLHNFGNKWFAVHGINIKEVLIDNGSEFTAYTSRKAKDFHFFETMLKIVDIKTAIPDRTDPKLMARLKGSGEYSMTNASDCKPNHKQKKNLSLNLMVLCTATTTKEDTLL